MSKLTKNKQILSPNGSTKFYFLLGNDISASPSPFMHTSWFLKFNLNAVYLPCQIPSEKKFQNFLTSIIDVENFHGCNITTPFKNTAIKTLNIECSHSVLSIGAANTLYKNKNNNWCFENTDIYGIRKTIKSLMPENNNYNLIVLGSGGAAASGIYYGIHEDKYCQQVFCFTRSPDKMLKTFPHLYQNDKLQVVELNTKNITILGIEKNNHLLIMNTLPPNDVTDRIIYNFLLQCLSAFPANKLTYFDFTYKKTFNLEFVKKQKINHLNGVLLLKEQATESFFLWTGIHPN